MKNQRKIKIVQSAVALLVGFSIFLAFLLYVGLGKVIHTMRTIHLGLFLVAVALNFASIGAKTFCWDTLLDTVNPNTSFPTLFGITLAGMFGNNITPTARSGGEVLRAYLLKKKFNISYHEGFATIVAFRLFDFSPFTIIGIFAILAIWLHYTLPFWVTEALLIALILEIGFLIGLVYVLLDYEKIKRVVLWFAGKLERLIIWIRGKHLVETTKEKIIGAVEKFHASFVAIAMNRRILSLGFLAAGATWIFDITRTYIVFYALGWPVPYEIVIIIVAVATIVSMIPLTPGGIGIVEIVMIILFAVAGVPSTVSAAGVFVDRIIYFWLTLALGGVTASWMGVKVTE